MSPVQCAGVPKPISRMRSFSMIVFKALTEDMNIINIVSHTCVLLICFHVYAPTYDHKVSPDRRSLVSA